MSFFTKILRKTDILTGNFDNSNNIISWGLINNEQKRKYKMMAWSSSKTTFNHDKWEKPVCSLAPACDDEIFFYGQK